MGKSYTVMVATDLHYLAPQLIGQGKAYQQLLQMTERMTSYSEELLQVFLSEVHRLRPDVVLLTGDMTFNGEKLSHGRLADGLASLGSAGAGVVMLPGNHDIDNIMAGAYLGEEAVPAEHVDGAGFAAMYRGLDQMGAGRVLARDPESFSVLYALGEKLWLLCTDINGNASPGAFARENFQWVEAQLELSRRLGARVVGASHQNLLSHNGLIGAGYVMAGADQLLLLYRRYGVKLHLSGHMHVQHVKKEQGITEIVTSSLSLPPCQYGVLEVSDSVARYRTCCLPVSEWAAWTGKEAKPLRHFEQFAKRYYLKSVRERILMELSGEEGPCKDKEALADGMARLSLAYFSGTMDQLQDREEICRLWKRCAPGNFWNLYFDSIFREGIKDETHARIELV